MADTSRRMNSETLPHLERVVLSVLKQLARARPIALWEAVLVGHMRLSSPMTELLWLVQRRRDLVCNTWDSVGPRQSHQLLSAGRLVGQVQTQVMARGVRDRGGNP